MIGLANLAFAAPDTDKVRQLKQQLFPAEAVQAATQRFVEEDPDIARERLEPEQKQCVVRIMQERMDSSIDGWLGRAIEDEAQVDELLTLFASEPGQLFVAGFFGSMLAGGVQEDVQKRLDSVDGEQVMQMASVMMAPAVQRFLNYVPDEDRSLEELKNEALETCGGTSQ